MWYAELCQRGAGIAGAKNTKEKNSPTHGHTHEPIHPTTPYNSSTTAVRSTAVVQHSTQQQKNIQQPTNPVCVYDNSTNRSTAEKTRNYVLTGEGVRSGTNDARIV